MLVEAKDVDLGDTREILGNLFLHKFKLLLSSNRSHFETDFRVYFIGTLEDAENFKAALEVSLSEDKGFSYIANPHAAKEYHVKYSLFLPKDVSTVVLSSDSFSLTSANVYVDLKEPSQIHFAMNSTNFAVFGIPPFCTHHVVKHELYDDYGDITLYTMDLSTARPFSISNVEKREFLSERKVRDTLSYEEQENILKDAFERYHSIWSLHHKLDSPVQVGYNTQYSIYLPSGILFATSTYMENSDSKGLVIMSVFK